MELTTNSVILLVTLVVVAAAVAVTLAIKYTKEKGLEGIRDDVYTLFLKAEHEFKHGDNGAKLQFVCDKAYVLLPKAVQVFVTPETLKTIINGWFRGVKDLLDDGKLNGSSKDT